MKFILLNGFDSTLQIFRYIRFCTTVRCRKDADINDTPNFSHSNRYRYPKKACGPFFPKRKMYFLLFFMGLRECVRACFFALLNGLIVDVSLFIINVCAKSIFLLNYCQICDYQCSLLRYILSSCESLARSSTLFIHSQPKWNGTKRNETNIYSYALNVFYYMICHH